MLDADPPTTRVQCQQRSAYAHAKSMEAISHEVAAAWQVARSFYYHMGWYLAEVTDGTG